MYIHINVDKQIYMYMYIFIYIYIYIQFYINTAMVGRGCNTCEGSWTPAVAVA